MASACDPADESSETAVSNQAEAWFGSFGPAEGIVSLELGEDFRYECLYLNGMSLDGCGDVEGSGTSTGTWECTGGRVQFTPLRETEALALSFRGAEAILQSDGMILTAEGKEIPLPKVQKAWR
ncbi:MAG: hypothetical protein DWQ01_02470 [Planctomycetota bacterium]|nr:MAG: hypothetical protein DWQ01_02470 [Planctomycetota bacterium]